MDEDTKILVNIRLERGREDLATARLLIREGKYRIAISRAYYAIFMVATAALVTLGVSRSEHSAVESAFGQYLVKPGILESKYHAIYMKARDWREEADYSPTVTFTEEDALTILAEAEEFVARLERYLKDNAAVAQPAP
jgi:uncharacterized protein (UPF0332 family)